MQNQKEQISQSYSLIGMDLFTSICPNLRSFKNLLLTGSYQNTGLIFSKEVIDLALQAVGIEESSQHDLTLNEYLLLLVMKRALMDAGLDQVQTDNDFLSTVVHVPVNNSSEPNLTRRDASETSLTRISKLIHPPITLENSVIVRGNFEDALERSLFLLENPSCKHLVLFSFFSYSSPHIEILDADSTNPAGDLVEDLLTGLGCIVLSNQTNADNSYADLIRKKFQSQSTNPSLDIPTKAEIWTENSDAKTQNEEYPHFQSAPIVRLIQSALSLNNQTHFPDPEPNWKAEELASEEYRDFLRPWFPLPYAEKRESVIWLQERKDNDSAIWLEKGYLSNYHPDQPFSNFGLYLLPISFDNPKQGNRRIEEIKKRITNTPNLVDFINDSLAEFESQKPSIYTLVVLGSSGPGFIDELEHAQDGVLKSIEDGRDWQTPTGSYFTPNPFGPKEKIAFVYPGAFGTYVGMGREIFYLFPQVQDALLTLTSDPGCAINETEIFPQRLTSSIREQLQNKLNNNPTQMISSGVCFSYLFTIILRDIFKVKPDVAFGYSLGENSMMFAMGVWTQADAMRTSLEASPIFHTRVSGQQNAIREFWKMPIENGENSNSSIWANYVLMAPFEKVRAAIQNEERVYITHINTPRQVVIGGEKNACKRVVDNIQCMHLQAPYHHSIHCEPIASEFDAFMRLHDWPVENKPDIPIYTAADYAPLQYDSKSIAKSFAKMLTNPIDFPRLVNLAYEDGARIFIELGAGNNCSKWVEATLKEKPHTTMSINQNNVDDHVSILKLLARLISHQIPVDLKALIGNSYGYQNE
jgi:PfaB family protein